MDTELILALDAGHCRQARALLRWTQTELAMTACVAKGTVCDFESGWQMPQRASRLAIFRAMENGGIEFRREDHGRIAVYQKQTA